jgi:hypothetical protein
MDNNIVHFNKIGIGIVAEKAAIHYKSDIKHSTAATASTSPIDTPSVKVTRLCSVVN